jgi:hypothetical protein
MDRAPPNILSRQVTMSGYYATTSHRINVFDNEIGKFVTEIALTDDQIEALRPQGCLTLNT